MAPQIITDCGNFTLNFKLLGICASPFFLQTLRPWFPNEMSDRPLVQDWLDKRYETVVVAHVLDMSVREGSWCTASCLSPLLVKLPHMFEWPMRANSLRAAVIPVACAPFPTTLSPSTQHNKYARMQLSVNSHLAMTFGPCGGCQFCTDTELNYFRFSWCKPLSSKLIQIKGLKYFGCNESILWVSLFILNWND